MLCGTSMSTQNGHLGGSQASEDSLKTSCNNLIIFLFLLLTTWHGGHPFLSQSVFLLCQLQDMLKSSNRLCTVQANVFLYCQRCQRTHCAPIFFDQEMVKTNFWEQFFVSPAQVSVQRPFPCCFPVCRNLHKDEFS